MCARTEQASAAMSMRQYEIPTGRVGLLTLWGGLFLQISTIVLLAGLLAGLHGVLYFDHVHL
jgi:hypothetical protein